MDNMLIQKKINRKKIYAMGIIVIVLVIDISISDVSGKINSSTLNSNIFTNEKMKKETIEDQWTSEGHDPQNTCLSHFPNRNNPGNEKWKFFVENSLNLITPIIDSNSILYISSDNDGLFAIYPNGTEKWHQDLEGFKEYQPAIGPDGTIYVGTDSRFHAFSPNGTLNWKLSIEKVFTGKPVVSPDKTIYVGTSDGYVYGINPNGTIKWEFYIGYPILSLSLDSGGNIYIAAWENPNLFSLYPNGTIRWIFEMPAYISDAPLIDPKGTIYVTPWDNIIAISQDGTEKWRIDSGHGSSPVLAPDGTLVYSSYCDSYIIDLNSENGYNNWMYDTVFGTEKSRPSVSSDGTIFFSYTDSTSDQAFLTALNQDGTLKWNTRLTSNIYPCDYVHTGHPSIGSDGTVYVTSWFGRSGGNFSDFGYLHAFGDCDPNAPEPPTVTGPSEGRIMVPYAFKVQTTSPLGRDVYYFVDWGDANNGQNDEWIGPYHSGQSLTLFHIWKVCGIYEIRVIAKDVTGLQGSRSGPRPIISATLAVLIGKICNLSSNGEKTCYFDATKLMYLQLFPPKINLLQSGEHILIFNHPHIGFLGERIVVGAFYTVVTSCNSY